MTGGGAAACVAPAEERFHGLHEIAGTKRLAERTDTSGCGPAVTNCPGHEAQADSRERGIVEDRPRQADSVHVGKDPVDEDDRGRSRAQGSDRLLTTAHAERSVAAVFQRERQESADGIVVLDDEYQRGVNFGHAGWIITAPCNANAISAHTFHRPVTVCDRRWAQSLVLW